MAEQKRYYNRWTSNYQNPKRQENLNRESSNQNENDFENQTQQIDKIKRLDELQGIARKMGIHVILNGREKSIEELESDISLSLNFFSKK